MKGFKNEKLSHGYYRCFIVCVCSDYVAFDCYRCTMTRSELQYQIWHDLGYLSGNTSPEYQRHLWKLSDQELFNLWLNIHNAREAYKNGQV